MKDGVYLKATQYRGPEERDEGEEDGPGCCSDGRDGDTRAWASSFTRIYCSQQQASGTQDDSGVEGGGCRQGQLFRVSTSVGKPLDSQSPHIKASMALERGGSYGVDRHTQRP